VEKLTVQPNAEQEMHELLNILSLSDLNDILLSLAEDLPEEQKSFYSDEVSFWGGLGQKNVIINNIIDLVPAEEIMGTVNSLTEDSSPTKQAQMYVE